MNGRTYPDTLLPEGVTELGLEGAQIYTATASGGNSRTLNRSGIPATVTAGKIVTLVGGPGAGQRREIASRTSSSITVAEPWDSYIGNPGAGTVFRVHDVAHPELRSQPQSSLVTCKPGDRVLMRVANLGYQQHAMTLDGIELLVVGRDSTFLGQRLYRTSQIDVAPGEAYDVIFTAPAHSGGVGPDVYMFYDRNFDNEGTTGEFGGMATEVHVYPATFTLCAARRCRMTRDCEDAVNALRRTRRRNCPPALDPARRGRDRSGRGRAASPPPPGARTRPGPPRASSATTASSRRAPPPSASSRSRPSAARSSPPTATRCPMWGFASGTGAYQYPSPFLCAQEGDHVTVVLHNEIGNAGATPVRTSIMFPGQDDVTADGVAVQPELVTPGTPADGLRSLVPSVVPGNTVTYAFTATHAGTYIYESGTSAAGSCRWASSAA